jgi:hypothetical protein
MPPVGHPLPSSTEEIHRNYGNWVEKTAPDDPYPTAVGNRACRRRLQSNDASMDEFSVDFSLTVYYIY